MADGTKHLSPEEADYSQRLFDAVLNQVIGLDADEAGTGGFVQPDIIRMVLAEVAAAVDSNCGIGNTPRDRRVNGEDMGKRYAAMLKSLVEDKSGQMASWAKATPIGAGTVN
jgi:hypothetical protein